MIKVVARNTAQPEKLEEILKLYKELVELTRTEKGCIRYELYQDVNNPSIITMIEEWESKAALEEHFKAAHFVRIVPELKKLMAKETDLNIYSPLI